MQHLHVFLFFGLAWLIILGMVRSQENDVPSPGCKYLISPGNITLSCPAGMDIPVNFDVTKIRKNVLEIKIAAGNGNILRSDAPPLPADLTALRKITLYGFTNEYDTRIAIKRFLDNVKGHITELRIYNSKLGFLEDTFLGGFDQLTKLDLSGCDIFAIDTDAFRGSQSSDPIMSVDLSGNSIESIDWAVFQPFSSKSLSLQLGSQKPGLQSISCSQNYTFSRPIGSVGLYFNRLESLLPCVIDSLNYDASSTLYVDYNPFCPTDGMCGCPTMEPFLRFACKDVPVNLVTGFKCGPANNQRSWTTSQMPPSAPCGHSSGVQRLLHTSWGIVVATALTLLSRL
ncbi:uncharacterized protein LOC129591035 [Paramacrobiotus metropolitanus]|uniref:uncharacterized protein LOC129591035 n=1 Tax=Paramacrobiotus metropolitanus TaxID=2943436 RepID=UPI002446321D|nr:uncharacterized protein LOC129591035 [Paramacrobiotus metropolitanus]